MFENFPQIIFKLTEILLEDFFINLYLFLYILMVFLVFLFRFWGWLIFQPCLWGYFLGSLIVSFKNPLRVKTHFFAFFNFFNFLLLYPPLVVSLLRDLDSPPPEFAYYVRMGAQQTVNEDVVMSTDEWRIWEGLMTITKFRGF